jgi:hypothetical protein
MAWRAGQLSVTFRPASVILMRATLILRLSILGPSRAVEARGGEHRGSAALFGSQAHSRVPGKLLPRSIQFGIPVAPRLPHRVHRMCRPNDATDISSGQRSTLTSVWYPQALQVTSSPRTPFRRMLPRVIGWIGSSSLPYFQAKNRQGTKSSAPAQLVLVMKPILFRVMT